jgi:hypothetical protein
MGAVDEWKDFKDENEKDYSGLKIQKLTIQEAEDEPDNSESTGSKGDAQVAKNVWKSSSASTAEEEKPDKPSPPLPEPKAAEPEEIVHTDKAEPSSPEQGGEAKKSAYVPPALRRQMGAPAAPQRGTGQSNFDCYQSDCPSSQVSVANKRGEAASKKLNVEGWQP